MAVQVIGNSPLAQALQNVVQPKLVEVGWGGVDDSTLAEYIILMLVNGKTQDQIASELSNDLLGLGPDDHGAIDFSQWLFEQVDLLNNEMNKGTQNADAAVSEIDNEGREATRENEPLDYKDTDMADNAVSQTQNSIPTGPKAMRTGMPNVRDKRMLGQINRTLDRSSDALRRVRGTPGTGRISSHAREVPKGPRLQQNFQMRGAAARNQMLGSGPTAGPMQPLMTMTPQQQMQFFAVCEEQARAFAQILSPQQQTSFAAQGMNGPLYNAAMPNSTPPQQPGKSLFERVQGQPRRQQPNRPEFRKNHSSQDEDNPMSDSMIDEHSSNGHKGANGHQNETKDPAHTICIFNLSCTKAECPYAHQSPAAPPGITIDVTDVCMYGAACKNRKCVGRHPSPAKRNVHQAVQDCKFYPNCTNLSCPFRHPDMPPCRNGADCTVSSCKFAHSKIECRYNPCLNPSCPFKHADGQKRGAFEDKVWVADGDKGKHVSERKFVADDGADEELILPTEQGISGGTAASNVSTTPVVEAIT